LLKCSYDGHLLEYGQIAQVSKPIRLLLQIKISKKISHKLTQVSDYMLLGASSYNIMADSFFLDETDYPEKITILASRSSYQTNDILKVS
jgi:hypothetical protein